MEELVAARLLPFCGHSLGDVYGKKGSDYIKAKAVHFHHLTTESAGVLVLTDFRDSKVLCIVEALKIYMHDRLPHPPKNFLYCFSINELESWLLADKRNLAKFLRINASHIPENPDSEDFPKRTLVNLARKSNKPTINEGLAPPPGHVSDVGPSYIPLMSDFISNNWDIEIACCSSPSLSRCVQRLREL